MCDMYAIYCINIYICRYVSPPLIPNRSPIQLIVYDNESCLMSFEFPIKEDRLCHIVHTARDFTKLYEQEVFIDTMVQDIKSNSHLFYVKDIRNLSH